MIRVFDDQKFFLAAFQTWGSNTDQHISYKPDSAVSLGGGTRTVDSGMFQISFLISLKIEEEQTFFVVGNFSFGGGGRIYPVRRIESYNLPSSKLPKLNAQFL